jgi:hypothetical protein
METCYPLVSLFTSLTDNNTYSHEDTAYTYVRTQSFAYPRAFPKDTHESTLLCQRRRTQSRSVAFCTRSCFGP